MNSTKLTPQQLGDLKREFANLMVGDMSPRELFEFAIHRVTCECCNDEARGTQRSY